MLYYISVALLLGFSCIYTMENKDGINLLIRKTAEDIAAARGILSKINQQPGSLGNIIEIGHAITEQANKLEFILEELELTQAAIAEINRRNLK